MGQPQPPSQGSRSLAPHRFGACIDSELPMPTFRHILAAYGPDMTPGPNPVHQRRPKAALPRLLRRSALPAACWLALSAAPQLALAWTFETIHHFNGDDGANPESQPVIDARGNLFGTTIQRYPGKGPEFGTLWGISRAGKFSTLHWFHGPTGLATGGTPRAR